MINFKLIGSIAILLAGILLYRSCYPKTYRKLQFAAYASKNLEVNTRINAKSFYTRLIRVYDTKYKYFDPVGTYTTSSVRAHTKLDTLNTSSQKQSYLGPTFAQFPIRLEESVGLQLRQGDEIVLSVNGKIFPEKSERSGGLVVMDISKATGGKIQILLTISSNHFSDSLWLKNSDDVIPIILKRLSARKCTSYQRRIFEMDSVSGKGRYLCVDKNSINR